MASYELDIAWAAGFLEGEGCFYTSDGYVRITAGQKDRESLDRLQAVLGGRIYDQRNRDLYLWSLSAQAPVMRAIDVLYPLLSTRRRVQIDAALSKRVQRGVPNGEKTHCPRGHAYDLKVPGEGRRCLQCRREQQREATRRWGARSRL